MTVQLGTCNCGSDKGLSSGLMQMDLYERNAHWLTCCEEVLGSSSGFFVKQKCTDWFHGSNGLSCMCPCSREIVALDDTCRKADAVLKIVVNYGHAALAAHCACCLFDVR